MFRRLILTVLATAGTGALLWAQQSETLFTYGGTPVSKGEFIRVYQKNNVNKKSDFSEKALRNYLDLYSIFRMKVAEADAMHLDTLASIQRELDGYRRQLARNYLSDKQVTDRLLHEAYDRLKEEVHVAHIMVSAPMTMSPNDTLAAKARIDSIYTALQKGADFSAIASSISDDRGSKERGGDVGYVTALQTLYPFENAVYNTPVGKFSQPFRSQFGYHIVKVLDKRPARGEVSVAHILLATPQGSGTQGEELARKRADSVMRDLKAGKKWDELVKKYSDDKFTVNNLGELQRFGAGRMVPAFETAAFALKKPGDISQPVKTDYGYHIIKLIAKYPPQPFDSVKDELSRRIENDSRSQIARDKYLEDVKKENRYKEYPENLEAIIARMQQKRDTAQNQTVFKGEEFRNMNQPLFELGDKKYLQSDFMNFAEQLTRGRLSGPKEALLRDIFRIYVERTVTDYQEHRLADVNPDFKNLMDEYRSGIMLFELMDRKVWSKANQDSAGLTAYYNAHKSKYSWQPGFSGAVIRAANEEALKRLQDYVAQHPKASDEELLHALNTEAQPNSISIQRGRYEYEGFKEIPAAAISVGTLSKAVKSNDGTYTLVLASEKFDTPTAKTLEEARGFVVSDYQDYLEQQWDAQLRSKYPVVVNEKALKSLVK